MSDAAPGRPGFAMSIDVEEHFQVWAMRPHVARADWERLPSRVERNTDSLLEVMAETGTRATFFTLGWVAERHKGLVRRIVEAGHELASHGWDHQLVHEQSRAEFTDDVRRAKDCLEQAGGVAVRGYRAANFSIDRRTPWAHEVLAEAGYVYSSSSHPVRNDHYGDPAGKRLPHRSGRLAELPVTTAHLLGQNLPCAGGGYFRLLPYGWTLWALRRAERHGEPVIFYLHPWEIDPEQPRPIGLGLKTRIRHYHGLDRCLSRLKNLLERHPWQRIDEALAGVIDA